MNPLLHPPGIQSESVQQNTDTALKYPTIIKRRFWWFGFGQVFFSMGCVIFVRFGSLNLRFRGWCESVMLMTTSDVSRINGVVRRANRPRPIANRVPSLNAYTVHSAGNSQRSDGKQNYNILYNIYLDCPFYLRRPLRENWYCELWWQNRLYKGLRTHLQSWSKTDLKILNDFLPCLRHMERIPERKVLERIHVWKALENKHVWKGNLYKVKH